MKTTILPSILGEYHPRTKATSMYNIALFK